MSEAPSPATRTSGSHRDGNASSVWDLHEVVREERVRDGGRERDRPRIGDLDVADRRDEAAIARAVGLVQHPGERRGDVLGVERRAVVNATPSRSVSIHVVGSGCSTSVASRGWGGPPAGSRRTRVSYTSEAGSGTWLPSGLIGVSSPDSSIWLITSRPPVELVALCPPYATPQVPPPPAATTRANRTPTVAFGETLATW